MLAAGSCWFGLGSNFSGSADRVSGHAQSLTGFQGNRHNLPLTRNAAMDMSAIGWSTDCIQVQTISYTHGG